MTRVNLLFRSREASETNVPAPAVASGEWGGVAVGWGRVNGGTGVPSVLARLRHDRSVRRGGCVGTGTCPLRGLDFDLLTLQYISHLQY